MVLLSSGGGSIGSNDFIGLGSVANNEGQVQQIVSVGGIFTELRCFVNDPSPTGHAATFRLRINGANTSLTCTLADGVNKGTPGGAAAVFAPGDLIDVSSGTTSGLGVPGSFAVTIGP